jgi:CRISPR-associated protein Cst2
MDMHALNNEGSESNRLMTRQVGIVTPAPQENGANDYKRFTVNAISGDMNKHIFADAFRHFAVDLELPVCPACQALDPARMMGNLDFQEYVEARPAPPIQEIIDHLLACAVDDVCGILITGQGVSVKRKSAVEFGWTVGLPDITEVQEFIHARHAITRLTRTRPDRDADEAARQEAAVERQRNIGQMVFTRPASSGVYAFVAHLDVAAIGFNDASQLYPDHVRDRARRLRAALMSLAQTVLHPKGALTSTQLPHVVDAQGFVSVSSSAAAAPLLSPLADNFMDRGSEIARLINRLHGENAVQVLPFDGSEGLLGRLADVIENTEPGQYLRE